MRSERSASLAKVLVVDDDPSVLELLVRTLTEAGLHAVPAMSVQQALVAGEAFDVLVVDYRLPDGTWVDVIRHFPATPVVRISGSGEAEVDLYKPFPLGALVDLVRAKLEQKP